MQLYYNPEITDITTKFSFGKEESRHITKVLRKTVGDTINITNGKGWMFVAEISIPDVKKCTATIISKEFKSPKDYQLHLAVAPTKMNDRYEWFLEKATEIGIDSITPIICAHSERKIIKQERLEKILQTAMKQSLQYYIPTLHKAVTFKQFMQQEHSGLKYIAHCEETDKTSLKDALKAKQDVTILIGPEGDFSSTEIDMATAKGYIPTALGNTRLRTETAAIVACHSVAFINEH